METYEIKGMTCQHCVRTVTSVLAKVPGVTAVRSVDLGRGQAEIEGSPDEQAVIAVLREEGYEARRSG